MDRRRDHHQDPYADDDVDADLDLELNELDPYDTPQNKRGFGRRIPLRNLRRRPREDDEGLKALVGGDDEDGEGRRQSNAGEESRGLLGGGEVEGTNLNEEGAGTGGDFRTRRRKGLWRFLPFGRTTSIALPTTDSPIDSPASNRIITAGNIHPSKTQRYPPNTISNTKYTPLNFLPLTLYHEFKFFFNLYFLLVALSQIIPALRIGYLSTYVAPLAFVMSVTLGKEAWDDLGRRRRDRVANGEAVRVIRFGAGGGGAGMKERRRGKKGGAGREGKGGGGGDKVAAARVKEMIIPSWNLKVGDVIVLSKDQRVPADVVILKSLSSEASTNIPSDDAEEGEGSDTTLVDTDARAGDKSKPDVDNKTMSEDPSGGGEAFIRTDQLDGETDWKLRLASPLAQTLPTSEYIRLRVTAGKPDRNVNGFIGTLELLPATPSRHQPYDSASPIEAQGTSANIPQSTALTIDNTAWANTVLASTTTVHAVVIYTGTQTRAAMSTSSSRSKTGLLENEINTLTKILCFLTAALSLTLVVLERVQPAAPRPADGSEGYAVAFTRFLILFSTIVPISLRVNLDMAKSVYAYFIHRDPGIPGTVVRTSTIPEDLGRVEFLLSDKTGTLTRNEMVLRKVFVAGQGFGGAEGQGAVRGFVRRAFGGAGGEGGLWTPGKAEEMGSLNSETAGASGGSRSKRIVAARIRDLVVALALCHNVTPTSEEEDDGEGGMRAVTTYQASSPDEIAIVQWTKAVGLRLAHRDRKTITLESAGDDGEESRMVVKAEILHVFPFTSDSKRMGIILRFLRYTSPQHSSNDNVEDGEEAIVFFQKGADTAMAPLVQPTTWLAEETDNLAREGLRTLVIGRKQLSKDQCAQFNAAYSAASLALSGRDAAMAKVVKQHLECDEELLGITGVEDKLQEGVKSSLEVLRNAGIKIWMLTGDKVETARCIALSSKLVPRGQTIHTVAGLKTPQQALDALLPLQNTIGGSGGLAATATATALLIDGQSLALLLTHHTQTFIETAVKLPAVIACRCTPTQKAVLTTLIRQYTGKRTLAIGDGGNDVSMICAADIGIGIEGKEGQQASLAADFSVKQFSHVTKLLLWHGRNSYKRSAKLAQFVIYRGLIISVAQTVFSVAGGFEPVALYRDWLLVGYATIYTMMPVFSLVLDRDVDEGLARLYPELYKELVGGRSLSVRSFGIWCAVSLYQGLVIQGGAEILLPSYLSPTTTGQGLDTTTAPFRRMVSISYTALILTEILMVAIEITTWHPIMIFSCLGTILLYFATFPTLGGYFDLGYVVQGGMAPFWWRVGLVTAASVVPVAVVKWSGRRWRPSGWRKVRG
ncbi:putative aminophospholipid-translocase [Recurvomyces mirabilis]|uniref:Phospholipid-transporting ATPase n=1 Tax=Recurvomyces mirabilis TaxID=574656 RepID=A0AAE1BYR0_9PEZI|nr:putative aminophospholipid-translocase [Recurvomyces mirabilis]KAK5155502.1 putative aminophospholipid-translocase [Recurvomyces mirabilis]